MSMNDPIADMLTRIRNAQAVRKKTVSMPASRIKAAIAAVLKEEGYILNFRETGEGAENELELELKYMTAGRNRPAAPRKQAGSSALLRRGRSAARAGRTRDCGREYVKGVMSDARARREGHGGEILCTVA